VRNLLGCLVMSLLPLCVAAQAEAPVVREIAVRNDGAGPVQDGFVLSSVGSAVGEKLDGMRVAADVRALAKTGRFTHVAAEVEELADGVRLVFAVRSKLRLAEPLEISGAKRFSNDRVRDMIGLRPGDLIDEQTLGVKCLKVLDAYLEDNYPDASIEVEVVVVDKDAGTGRGRAIIDEGARARTKRFVFRGNSARTDSELMDIVEPRGWWAPTRWFDRWRHDPDRIEGIRSALEESYRDSGFLDATVTLAETRRTDHGIEPVFEISEGKVYRVGSVTVEGATLFPQAEVTGVLGLVGGRPASAASIRAARQALADFYGSRGYIDSRVSVSVEPADGDVVDLRFTIAEGNLTRIRNIRIRGNTRTKDKVIRRELLVYPGDVYDKARVKRSERRVQNLGYFSMVRSHPEDGGMEAERDLVFDVDEKRTGMFMIGAGFSSVDQVMGFIELSQGNFDISGWPFIGAGQKLKLRAQLGEKRRSYDISFVEPWFMDEQLALGIDLYRIEKNYSDYDITKDGAAVSLSTPLPGPNRVQIKYGISSSSITDVSDTNEYYYVDDPSSSYRFLKDDSTIKSEVGLTLRHDTRNNAFVPTAGNRVTFDFGVAGGWLGGDTDTYEMALRTWHYLPLWLGHVISLRTRYQVVDSYVDDQEVPIDDRLFLGGGQTLRGFDYRDVGPKVLPAGTTPETGRYRPVGGRSLAMASLEYTIPVVNGIRFAAYYDTGNVWADPYDLDLSDLASSAGIGIRFDVPGFPIRIDYAWVLEPDDELTEEDPWVIWIGYDY